MKVLTREQTIKTEKNAVSNGIFSYSEMMENAGRSAACIVNDIWNVKGKDIVIVCGSGNNGGDGLVLGDVLRKSGANISLFAPFGMPKTDTALPFLRYADSFKIIDDIPSKTDFLVDALFGTGLDRSVEGKAADIIDKMNWCSAKKIALDIPSGAFCDGGISDSTFIAELTITFISLKPCHLLPPSSEFCGKIEVCDIGVSVDEFAYQTIEKPQFKTRPKNSHKGTFGTALLFCGSYGMCGAEILAATAAARSGVGIVKAVVCDKNYSAFTASLPEAVLIPVSTANSGAPLLSDREVFSALSGSDALLIGCGLGRSEEAVGLVKKTLLTTNVPTVIDADGINAISNDINIIRKVNAPVIITPHPAEMARICKVSTTQIEANRIAYSRKIATEYNCVVVLKGANTIVASPDGRIFFNTNGNPGMASAGSGDVLAGITVSLLAQGVSPLKAALNSVWLHGAAGDIAAQKNSQEGMIASDIITELKTLF